jgi:hypothetical protein
MTAGVDAAELGDSLSLSLSLSVHTLVNHRPLLLLLLGTAAVVVGLGPVREEMFTVCMDDSTTGNNNTPFFRFLHSIF